MHVRSAACELRITIADTGTGLGLWISKGIVDKHQGRMHMKSRLKEEASALHGTVFSMWLPLEAQA